MSTIQDTRSKATTGRSDPLTRWLPLSGAVFAVLAVVGTLVIDKFPDESTTPGALVRYYASHHAQVGRGGAIATLSCVFFGLFAAGLAARARRVPVIAAVIAVGGAAEMAVEVQSNSTYALLGSIGNDPHVDPAALQAWHISGAAFGSSVPAVVFLLGVAMAALVGGVAGRALPRWIGWTALALAVCLLAPGLAGFFASMLIWPWALATGIALSLRPAADEPDAPRAR